MNSQLPVLDFQSLKPFMIPTKAPRIGSSLNACTEKEHTNGQKCPHLKIHGLCLTKGEANGEKTNLWARIFVNLSRLFAFRMSSLDLRTVGFVKGAKSSFDVSQ